MCLKITKIDYKKYTLYIKYYHYLFLNIFLYFLIIYERDFCFLFEINKRTTYLLMRKKITY